MYGVKNILLTEEIGPVVVEIDPKNLSKFPFSLVNEHQQDRKSVV